MGKLGELASRIAERWIPHPFVFAILLSAVAFLLGILLGGATPFEMLGHWYGGDDPTAFGTKNPGFFSFLAFAMQMCLILISGFALAHTKAVRGLIEKIAAWPRGTASAAMLTGFVAAAAALLNWGLGLIVGALLAREIGRTARRDGRRICYPLVVAAGYLGLAIWHGGFSGSAPLKATTDLERFLRPETRIALAQESGVLDAESLLRMTELEALLAAGQRLGAVEQSELRRLREALAEVSLPLERTLGSPLNLVVTGLLLLLLPLMVAGLAPRDPDRAACALPEPAPPEPEPVRAPGLAGWLENSYELSALIAILGVAALVVYFRANGLSMLDPNAVILLFLFLGLLLHGRPRRFVAAVEKGAASCGGIMLQFPFYAGIMAMLKGSGAGAALASGIVRLSGESGAGYLLTTFFGAGLLNVFVPSGGGQWAIQADLAVSGALELGVDPGRAVMAVAYGDQWTNLLQPFWALPLLGLTGLKARQIFGYTVVVAVLAVPLYALPLLLL